MSTVHPTVGIVMGSDSDLETLEPCIQQLREFGISCEVRVISAHRTPGTAHEYSKTAVDRGLKVIIAAAGMAAALPGVLASRTTLPVIGVPIPSGPLNGMDAMVSILQMPPGVPVGTMAIGSAGAKNAAVFAAQILAVGDPHLASKLMEFKKNQAHKTLKKDKTLQSKLS